MYSTWCSQDIAWEAVQISGRHYIMQTGMEVSHTVDVRYESSPSFDMLCHCWAVSFVFSIIRQSLLTWFWKEIKLSTLFMPLLSIVNAIYTMQDMMSNLGVHSAKLYMPCWRMHTSSAWVSLCNSLIFFLCEIFAWNSWLYGTYLSTS